MADKVTTVGTGVDDAVLQIAKSYEVRGMVDTITSHSTVGPAVPAGSSSSSSSSSGSDVVNQVTFEYTDAALLDKEYQEHDGPKNASTPYVGYNHDQTISSGQYTKGLRPTSLRFPNGRLVHYTYGAADSTADALNRIAAINDGSPGDSLAEYQYLGQNAIVQVDYPEPDLRYDLAHGGGDDPYDGPMDRFGRVSDLLWRDYGSSTDAVRIQHGYDRAGNRLYREDPVAASNGKHFDELYTYDGVNQLKTLDRGDLNGSKTAITGTPAWEEDWTLDPTGNWTGYVQKTSGVTDLDQSRTQNKVNEITDITEAVGQMWITPTHDRNGNMLRVMKPDDPENYYTLQWDAWNRLTRVSNGATTVAEYQYDGRDFRIVKKTYSAGQLNETRHFYYNNAWQCLEERVDASTNPDRQFLWGPRYIDDLILRDRDTSDPKNGTLDERLYVLQDSHWNVVALSGADGNVAERYSYIAFGKRWALDDTFDTRSSSQFDMKTSFAGRPVDSVIAVLCFRERLYDAVLGRFLTVDPMEYWDNVNLRTSLGNNPLTWVDPSGTQAEHDDPDGKETDDGADVCCACEKAISGQDIETISTSPKMRRKCRSELYCGEKCPHGAAGWTYPPKPGKDKIWVIRVCVSCGVTDKSLDVVIRHELIHVKAFCKTGGIYGCDDCKSKEHAAYTKSCGIPKGRCVRCGVYFSCKDFKTKTGDACVAQPDPSRPCTFADIGIELKL